MKKSGVVFIVITAIICVIILALLLSGILLLGIFNVDNIFDFFQRNEKVEHTHEYGGWQGDDLYHWKEATCHSDIEIDKSAHRYNGDFICTECGRYYEQNALETQIRHALDINIYDVDIKFNHLGDDAYFYVREDVLKTSVGGAEVYYKFNQEFTEVYTMSDDGWTRENMMTYGNGGIFNYMCENYPALTMLSEAGRQMLNDFTFDPIERVLTFEYEGVMTDTMLEDFSGTITYGENMAATSIKLTFSYNGAEYDLEIIHNDSEIQCPSVVSAGISLELTEDGSYKIKDMGDCTDINVVIPSEINGIPVTEICDEAFKNNTYIQSVVIPGSVKTIGTSAFEGCSSLQTIVLQDGVEEIGEKAFYMANPLAYLEFTDSITKIGEDAFTYDVSYSNRGKWNFIGDINKYVQIEFGNADSNPSDNRDMYVNGVLLEEVTLDTATRVNSYAFVGHSLIKNYYIGSQVEYFGTSSITSFLYHIDHATGAAIFEAHNFYYEGTLEQFMSIRREDMWVLGEWNLYCNDRLIDTVVFEGVEHIQDGIFYQCVSLKHLIIKEGVKSVGRCAFYRIDFETVELPESLTEFGYWAFSHYDIEKENSIFTMVEYTEGDIYHLAIYMKNADNPYYLLVERSYTNVAIHEDCKYRQLQQWELPEYEDWFEDPRPTT